MNETNKIHFKAPIIIISAIVMITAVTLLCFNFYTDQVHFFYDTVENFRTSVEGQNEAQMIADGYHVSYPEFRNDTSWGTQKNIKVYNAVSDKYMPYILEAVDTYNNYLSIDFSVTEADNTLTIAFTGYGVTDNGTGEQITLNKDFIFDITDVNADTVPVLISN